MKTRSHGALRPTIVDKNGDRIWHSTPLSKAEKGSVLSKKIDSSLSPIKKVGSIEEGTGFHFMDLDVLGNVFNFLQVQIVVKRAWICIKYPKRKWDVPVVFNFNV